MNFAKKFLQKTPLNLSYIQNSNQISSLQYIILAPKYLQGGPIRVPHSCSNKQDPIQMSNTLSLLHELFKSIKSKTK